MLRIEILDWCFDGLLAILKEYKSLFLSKVRDCLSPRPACP